MIQWSSVLEYGSLHGVRGFRAAAGRWAVGLLMVAWYACPATASPAEYFVIRVVDEQTGRGVPMVELRTTDDVARFTDSTGVVAYLEPGQMNRKVYFAISSPGYEYPADGFGFRGKALETVPGASATVKIRRVNVAERLYRLTGAGVYRDSILAGLPVPLRAPLLNADVTGQDSVLATPYRGKLRWFWGDTNRPDYPLGNFGTTGAVSPLATDPDRGVNFTYFTAPSGSVRPMIPTREPGPVWVSAVTTIENGARLIGYYSRMESLGKALERGLVVYNDAADVFDRVARFDAARPLPLDGHPLLASVHGTEYVIGTRSGAAPLPVARVRATLEALKDPASYESYTCLKPGSSEADAQPERAPDGALAYAWKRGAPPLTLERQKRLIEKGAMRPGEGLILLRDVETGIPVNPHSGSVAWNAYTKRWVMLFGQSGGGISNVGEIWFAEADTPVGPWIYARKVATHPKMDFYNPTQHPFFDQEGGRRLYFEGTYVNTFSGNPVATPRYNYNQILYRLTLDDPRLSLPLPVYQLHSGAFAMRDGLMLPAGAASIRSIPFYAVPTARPHAGLIPIYRAGDGFQSTPPATHAAPLCYGLSPAARAAPETLPLKDNGGHTFARVWKNPQTVLALDFSLEPLTQN